MGFLDFFKGKQEARADPEERAITGNEFFNMIFNSIGYISQQQAENIPAVAACINYIAGKIALMPVRLYEKTPEGITEKTDDTRIKILNNQPSEFFSATLFKRMLVKDYLLNGVCYAYIRRKYNIIEQIIYIPYTDISKASNLQPLNTVVKYYISGNAVDSFNLFRAVMDSTDGVTGRGILNSAGDLLKAAYAGLIFENAVVSKQGVKRGFLTSEHKLTKEAFEELKKVWPEIYKNSINGEQRTAVLNNGIKFEELDSTASESQIVEINNKLNENICAVFGLSPSILNGTATTETEKATIKTAVLPIAKALETACNNYLLLESEKNSKFFVLDPETILQADAMERYQTYETGIKNGFLQIDEARERENMPPLGLNLIKLGLQDVLFDPVKNVIYNPNSGSILNLKGGEQKE